MRTTVDLPDDVLERVRSIAADRRRSVSNDRVCVDPRTGLKVLDLGRLITMDEVRQAMDDE